MSAPALLLALAVLSGGRGIDASPPRTPQEALSGTASWFASPRGSAAAGPALRAALGPSWRGSEVTVSAGGRSVAVTLSGWCLCRVGGSARLIDLPRADFAALADPSLGLVASEVSW